MHELLRKVFQPETKLSMKKYTLFTGILLFSIVMFGQESRKMDQNVSAQYPMPKVDRRIELLSIVFRLAGNFEYNDDVFRSYVSDIHSHFDKYTDHPVIAFARKLHNRKGVSFDAVQAMAIHLEQPPALNPVVPFSAEVPEKRWGKENAVKFAGLLKQFYTDARCEEFFVKHEGLYKTAQERYIPVYTVDNNLPTIIHEFNHSWVNPLTKKYENELALPGKKLFDRVKKEMSNQYYKSWQTMMNESLVRASVIRYLLRHDPDGKAARNQLKSDISRGFFWMKGLVESLGVYEKNRDTYPTLESYLPVLIDHYNGVARESGKMFEIKI
jgi:hypothetical protein